MEERSTQTNIIFIMITIIAILASLNNSSIIKIPIVFELSFQFLSYGFCLIYFIKNAKLTTRKLSLILIIFALIVYTCYITKIYTLLASFVIFLMSMFLDYKKIIKSILCGIVLVIAIHLIYGLIVNPEYVLYRNTHRYYLGYYSPNTIGTLTLWGFLAYCYLTSFKKVKCTIAFLLSFFIYYLTNSRSLLLCSTIMYFYIIMLQDNKKINVLINFFAKYCIVFFTILFIVLISLYNSNNSLVLKIDEMMTGRLFYSSYAINNNGYTMLPKETNDNPIYYKTSFGFSVDIGYVIFLYKYGIVYILILELLGIWIYKQNNHYYSILFIIWSIDLCLESFGINFIICFAPIFASKYLVKSCDESENHYEKN